MCPRNMRRQTRYQPKAPTDVTATGKDVGVSILAARRSSHRMFQDVTDRGQYLTEE